MPKHNIFILTLGFFLYSDNWVYAAQQPEYVLSEQSIPESAAEIKGSLAKIFERIIKREPLFPNIRKKLATLPPVLSDTRLNIEFRSYYFDRENVQSNNNLAWTYGGALVYRSGWWKEFFQLGATFYISQKIIGPKDQDGTLLLKPGQQGFEVLGEAFLKGRIFQGIEFKLFRQTLSLPYINKQDNRMVPNTYEAYLIMQQDTSLNWITGYVRKIKKRNSDKFEFISEAAGLEGTKKGMALFGARYVFTDYTDFGVIDHFSEDYLNTFYTEANHVLFHEQDIPIHLALQYTNQQSVGTELGGKFDSYSLGGKVALSYQGLTLTAAVTSTGKSQGIQKPFGGTPSFLSMMVEDFDRAGENAWLVGVSYHFKHIGLEGLSAFTNYAHGNTPETGAADSPDQSEWDITVDYKPHHDLLEGLWLRFRRAWINRRVPGHNSTDHRIILNYEIPLL